MRTPNILTIAGSDSGGGAGIQADLKTIMALDGYGMSVITALTAQNGLGVTGIHAPEPEFVVLQLRAVLDGFPVHAAKTGMLFSAGIINALADALRDRSFPLVVDPVSVSQSGSRLLREDAVEALKERMIPGCDLLTPNRPEAEMLTGMTISCADDAAAAGEALIRMGAKAVLIKGGHMESSIVVTDCLCQAGQAPKFLPQPKVETNNNHGTGCTLSAAIATGLLILVLGLAFCIERIIYLGLSEVDAKRLMTDIKDKVEGGDLDGARELCTTTRGPVAALCAQGLSRMAEPMENIERTLVAYGSVQAAKLERGCSWIVLFIAMAPSLGFLGTVIGMVMAFDQIQAAGDISPAIVASGMRVALITTIFGIIVALVLQVFYNLILSKIDHLTCQMEESVISLLDIIARHKGGQA